MPYKRKAHKGPSRQFAKKVMKVVAKKAEHKYVEANVAAIAFDATCTTAKTVKCLDQDITGNIAQGTTHQTRIGDRLRLLNLKFNGVLVPSGASGAVRLLIGQCIDKQVPSAMTMTYGDVLNKLSTGAAGVYDMLTSGYDHEPTFKYRLLCDEVITWDAQNTGAPILIRKSFSKFPVPNRNYDPASSTCTGAFFYMLISANGAAGNIQWPYAKITYIDV